MFSLEYFVNTLSSLCVSSHHCSNLRSSCKLLSIKLNPWALMGKNVWRKGTNRHSWRNRPLENDVVFRVWDNEVQSSTNVSLIDDNVLWKLKCCSWSTGLCDTNFWDMQWQQTCAFQMESNYILTNFKYFNFQRFSLKLYVRQWVWSSCHIPDGNKISTFLFKAHDACPGTKRR